MGVSGKRIEGAREKKIGALGSLDHNNEELYQTFAATPGDHGKCCLSVLVLKVDDISKLARIVRQPVQHCLHVITHSMWLRRAELRVSSPRVWARKDTRRGTLCVTELDGVEVSGVMACPLL